MLMCVLFNLFLSNIVGGQRQNFGYPYPSSTEDEYYHDHFRNYDQIILFNPQHNPSKHMSKSRQYVGQLIPPGQQWPQDEQGYASFEPVKRPNKRPTVIEDRLQDITSTKSPLEYKPNRPTFIGATGGSFVGQVIPSGQQWPASQEDYDTFSPTSTRPPNLEDRFKETTKRPLCDEGVPPTTQRTTKTPLEYVPNRPTFIGATGGSHLSQFIPSGQPWPSNPEDYGTSSPASKPNLEDRFKETTTRRVATRPTKTRRPQKTSRPPTRKTTTKSPLEFVPNRPSFAGPTGGSHVGQLIPSGDKLPFGRPTTKKPTILEDRIKETTPATNNDVPVIPIPTKSPLEYVPHRPSYAGSSNLGQIIPPGTPFPAGDVTERTTIRTKESNQPAVLNESSNSLVDNTTPEFEIFVVNKENIPAAAEIDVENDCEEDEELIEEEELDIQKGQPVVLNIKPDTPNTLEEEECEDDEEEINDTSDGTMLFTSQLSVTATNLQDKQAQAVRKSESSTARRPAASSSSTASAPVKSSPTPEITNLLLEDTEKILSQIDSVL